MELWLRGRYQLYCGCTLIIITFPLTITTTTTQVKFFQALVNISI